MSSLSLTVLTVVDVTIRQLCLIVCVTSDGLAGDITSWAELNWVIMPPTV